MDRTVQTVYSPERDGIERSATAEHFIYDLVNIFLEMRKTLITLLVAAMLVLAGCSAQSGGGGDATPESDAATTEAAADDRDDGTVSMYLSDERNAIDQFERLNVTVTAVSLQSAEARAEADVEANATADADADGASGEANASGEAGASLEAGWRTHAVDERSVDLTRLQGENATRLGNLSVASGEYAAVRLEVTEVEGTLKSGERVNVKLPSNGLVLTEAFTVGADGETAFVFDATVFEAGGSGKYVLKPVASESGTEQPIRLVDGGAAGASAAVEGGANASDTEANGNTSVGVNVTAGANASDDLAVEVVETSLSGVVVAITDAGEPVTGATVAVNGEVAGETDADGRVTVPLPEDPVADVTVDTGEATLETTIDLEKRLNAGADARS